jgi:hypothetical protein
MPKPIKILPAQSKADFYLPRRWARALDEAKVRIVRAAHTKAQEDQDA